MSNQFKKFEPYDDSMEDNESAIKYISETPNARRYSISKSGRFKQIVRHREALDETLFNDQDKVVINHNESSKSTSSNNLNNKKKKSINSSLGRNSYTDHDIEAWIENSFRSTFEDYKTLRKKSNASVNSNTIVDNDGHLETAL